MTTSNLYGKAMASFLAGINWTSDTIRMALTTSSYTPNLGTDQYWSTPVTNEITGTGYTARGFQLTSPTVTTTAANSWSVTAATSTAYLAGQVVKPSGGNGYLYRCIVAGTSGGSAPTWPTVVGQTVTDGTVTWSNCGESITIVTSASASWTSATFTANNAVIYKDTGTNGTSPLIAVTQFSSALSPSAGTLTITPDATYGWFALTPA